MCAQLACWWCQPIEFSPAKTRLKKFSFKKPANWWTVIIIIIIGSTTHLWVLTFSRNPFHTSQSQALINQFVILNILAASSNFNQNSCVELWAICTLFNIYIFMSFVCFFTRVSFQKSVHEFLCQSLWGQDAAEENRGSPFPSSSIVK